MKSSKIKKLLSTTAAAASLCVVFAESGNAIPLPAGSQPGSGSSAVVTGAYDKATVKAAITNAITVDTEENGDLASFAVGDMDGPAPQPVTFRTDGTFGNLPNKVIATGTTKVPRFKISAPSTAQLKFAFAPATVSATSVQSFNNNTSTMAYLHNNAPVNGATNYMTLSNLKGELTDSDSGSSSGIQFNGNQSYTLPSGGLQTLKVVFDFTLDPDLSAGTYDVLMANPNNFISTGTTSDTAIVAMVDFQ